jgi:hypothetical protein
MRAFFLLLVLANLAFFTYGRVALEGTGPESRIPQLQVAAERIRLVDAAEPVPAGKPRIPGKAASAAPPPSASAVPAACLEWGNFAGPGAAKAELALAELQLAPAQIERVVIEAGGYWVHIPPLKTKGEADRKVRELRSLGVTEFFVVQDAGPWRNAISLGIFRTEDAAQAFLAGLKQQGVRSAIAARRENFLKQIAFYVREPGEAAIARLTLIQQDFPGSEIRAVPCPPAGG